MSSARQYRRSVGNYAPEVMRLARQVDPAPGAVAEVIVEHDSWCAVFRARRCNCVPAVRLVTAPPPDPARN